MTPKISTTSRKRKNVEIVESKSSISSVSQRKSKRPAKVSDRERDTNESESSLAPQRRSERLMLARQESELTGNTKKRISDGSSSSGRSNYSTKDLPPSASKFQKEDMEFLNATFIPASENEVIPDVEVLNYPESYFLNIHRDLLASQSFDIDKNVISTDRVKRFFYKLVKVIRNSGLDIGRDESKTDSLVTHLLYHTVDFDCWPLGVSSKESYSLSIGDGQVSAKPEFVISNKDINMIVVEDKHLKNVYAYNDFGEAQILIEILAVANENAREKISDQTLYALRVISTYVTFYKVTISANYLKELNRDLPKTQSIEFKRWPPENSLKSGWDLGDPEGRKIVIKALTKIRQKLLLDGN